MEEVDKTLRSRDCQRVLSTRSTEKEREEKRRKTKGEEGSRLRCSQIQQMFGCLVFKKKVFSVIYILSPFAASFVYPFIILHLLLINLIVCFSLIDCLFPLSSCFLYTIISFLLLFSLLLCLLLSVLSLHNNIILGTRLAQTARYCCSTCIYCITTTATSCFCWFRSKKAHL